MVLPAAPSLIEHVSALQDPRHPRTTLCSLPRVLPVVLGDTLAGAEDFAERRRQQREAEPAQAARLHRPPA